MLLFSLSDSNGIRTHNHLVRKRTLNHLAKPFNHLSSLAKRSITNKLVVGSNPVAVS